MRFLLLAAAMSVAPIASLTSAKLATPLLGGSAPRVVAAQAPTYRDVAPILKANCVPCHKPGEVAPFSLQGYRNASQYAMMSAQVTREKRMPPWKPTETGVFHGERRLTANEITLLQTWANAGAPKGNYDPVHNDPEPTPVPAGHWQVGVPDKVLTIPRPYKISAECEDTYRYFVVKNPYAESKWLRGVELIPGNPKVVHHATIFLDRSGNSSRMQKNRNDGQEGYSASGGPQFKPTSVVGFWAPGMDTRPLPEGTAFELKPGASFVVQVHYTSTGKDETDQWKLGLYTSDQAPAKLMRVNSVESFSVDLPAGQRQCSVVQSMPINQDIEIHSLMPHAHQLGKRLRAIIQLPNGSMKQLIEIPDWDPGWQSLYWFKNPVKVPRGSILHFEAIYDNSDENPRNPFNPPQEIHWGEDAKAEMCLLVFLYTTR